MKVKVTVEVISDTECQDKFLRLALERLAWGKGDDSDRVLVLATLKARALPPNLTVELL